MQYYKLMKNLELISEVNNFMLTNKNITKFPIYYINKKEIQKKTNKVLPICDNSIFYPEQFDKLFWSFFIVLFGKYEYDIVSNYFTKEKEIKYKWIEEFRNHKHIFKKIKISRNNIEDELDGLLLIFTGKVCKDFLNSLAAFLFKPE